MANRSLILAGFGCTVAAAVLWPGPAVAQCRLCPPEAAAAKKPAPTAITIEIETSLDFSRIGLVARNQGGSATIDPVTGQRILTGALVNLAGLPVQGSVTVRGEKNEQVEIIFPGEVTLSTTGGGAIRLTSLTTSLRPNSKLDKDGVLSFTFGGALQIDGRSSGDFRGSIPITVNYR